MGITIYRVTGIALSIIIALLGVTVVLLLYYAGEDGLDLFYKDSTYKDENRRIHKRMPTDDWYGTLILRAWAFGFIYIVPGMTGFTASFFFRKVPMALHFVIGILALVVGSFLHTAGACAMILYWVFVENSEGLKYNTWPWDCKYVRYEDQFEQEYVDEKCTTGRRASILVIATTGVTLIAWLFLLSDLLYCGFTFHNIGKNVKKSKTSERPVHDRPRRRPYPKQGPPPPESTSTTDPTAATVTAPLSDSSSTTVTHLADEPTTSVTETQTTFNSFEEIGRSAQADSHQTDGAIELDVTEASGTDAVLARNTETALDMVQVHVNDEKSQIKL